MSARSTERSRQPPTRGPPMRYGNASPQSFVSRYGHSTAAKELKDVLERKIEDLSRQLTEERQAGRQSRAALSRLQRELARARAQNKPGKEQLSKELENERMLRVEAERRLHEMTRESESCQSRLESLQDEFRKMEGVVRDMLQYKTKIDQLKQEKSSLSVTYENNVQKFKKHITDLERENMLLLNDVKKLECQINNKTDGRDRSKLLLERLKMLEGENSSLVLENEQQRGQYEKCLDEIANQVVQALLAQKMLREECVKLQGRVHDLEHQNHHLCVMFHQRMKMAAEVAAQRSASGEAVSPDVFLQGSVESLQSMFSEQTSENLPNVPQMSSPPPWLQERLAGDRRSIVSFTGSVTSTPEFDLDFHPPQQNEFQCRTEIETEFPATPSSPKSKHVSIYERKPETKRSSSTSSLTSVSRGPSRPRTRSTSSLSRARGLSLFSPQTVSSQTQESGIPNATTNGESSPNQGNTQLTNQEPSSSPSTNQNSVPLNLSNPSISKIPSQGTEGRMQEGSKIPTFPATKKLGESQLRRNSLKAEYSIRMGCQAVQQKPNQTSNQPNQSSTSVKPLPGKPPKSKSPSVSTTSQPKSSSASSARSTPTGTRIPTVSRQTNQSFVSARSSSRENVNSRSRESIGTKSSSREHIQAKSMPETGKTQQKPKSAQSKLIPPSSSKLVPPKSPNLRYSGIRTTLKNEGAAKSVTATKVTTSPSPSPSPTHVTGVNSVSLKMRSVYAINPKVAKPSGEMDKPEEKKPPLPARGEKPKNRPETHYPIMGLTNLNHTSPKNETAETLYANLISNPSTFSSVVPSKENGHINDSAGDAQSKGQYFYDYSDEDSDFNSNRPVSKDYSIASSVSLDELLDQTLEGMTTPMDGDFKSDIFLLNMTSDIQQNTSDIKGSGDVDKHQSESARKDKPGDEKAKRDHAKNDVNDMANEHRSCEKENRLRGKPDIVKDTEACEQRNLKKSLTISQIPGSSLPGYRAKRPKSLILGANDKKFLYCEYGSSSSSDTSDEEWSYQYSYAKNIKQQEIQSKVAKSLKNGQAKLIESPGDGTTKIDIKTVKPLNTSSEKQTSKLPKPGAGKKPSRIPPPVALKPSRKNSLPETSSERPKSVEICVNTVLTSVTSKAYSSFVGKCPIRDIPKCDSEKCLNLSGNIHTSTKLENPDMTLTSAFDDVKVERSGSKDDGYSTMSSDVQPEVMEKYSDVLESSTNSNDNIRNSNLSLSSQNSFSSEDRQSCHGSLGRVRAMKMKFETENSKSPERESLSPKSPPRSPFKSLLVSPKRTVDNIKPQTSVSKESAEKTVSGAISKLPGSGASQNVLKSGANKNVPKEVTVTQKSAIPTPNAQTARNVKLSGIPRKEKSESSKSLLPMKTNNKTKSVEDAKMETNANDSKVSIPDPVSFERINAPELSSLDKSNINFSMLQDFSSPKPNFGNLGSEFPQTSTPKNLMEQFSQLSYFAPTVDKMSLFQDPAGDSNSSLSDRGSDLTSLHISEDNILSDIPEEREGYESSVGHRSECNSVTSIPATNSIKKPSKTSSHHSHSQSHSHIHQFTTTRKRYWSSIDGLVRASSIVEYKKQKHARESADYEELYGGCLNIETLLERSSSESDMYTRGDKPEVILYPRLPRSQSADNLILDEISVEEKVQAILKQNLLEQISKNVQSADKDEANFMTFVELLVQRGHVMETQSPNHNGRVSTDEQASDQTSQVLNKMAVSTLSSMGCSPNVDHFEMEEGEVRDSQAESVKSPKPVGDEQKKFNSQFYSLCNTGSSRSISDKSDSRGTETGKVGQGGDKKRTVHTCQNGDTQCERCEEERNLNEFDHISRQIESLSKTVNELHRSLSSLNSENSDSGSESNEGDSELRSAFGNKDIDGYQWVEDEFFLSPYGGEVILGGSPFSNTGASCDWMNEYTDNAEHMEETGGQESMHDEPVAEISFDSHNQSQRSNTRPPLNSVLAESIDKEGNFDSHRFISKRLEMEEKRLKLLQNDNRSQMTCDNANKLVKQSRIPPPTALKLRTRPLLKEDMRTTPEKDVDDSDRNIKRTELMETMATHYGSQDSLDDNIGVDNMMCHRLIGGKAGQNVAANSKPPTRPALDFSSSQFVRYGDLERQAVAAFDFLNEMTSSLTSAQSNDQKTSHDQLLRMEERRVASASNMNRMNYSTTSNESRTSPVKRNRRKLRPKLRKDQKHEKNKDKSKARKFSSTSADESDGDPSLSDSYSDEESPRRGKQSRPSERQTEQTLGEANRADPRRGDSNELQQERI